MTKTTAPHDLKVASESNSVSSILKGKSQIENEMKELLDISARGLQVRNNHIIIAKHIPSFIILLVLSKNIVSFGDILWKTTF